MARELSSMYRVVGFADNRRRMAMYDIPRDDTVWVNTVGYEGGVLEVLKNDLECGNLVEAEVTDAGGKNEYWDLLSIEVAGNTRLHYGPTDGYAPGNVEPIWEQREDPEFGVGAYRERDSDKVRYEVQMLAEDFEDEDGNSYDIMKDLQRGELLTEPLFAGDECMYIDGAQAVVVVDPNDRPYVIFYLFPELNVDFKRVWQSVYDELGWDDEEVSGKEQMTS